MSSQLKKNLSNTNYWFRAAYVVLFVIAAKIAATLVVIIAVLQVVLSLVTGQPNQKLTQFGDSLAQYLYQCYLFMSFKSEEKPFPFADWPEGKPNAVMPVVDPDSNIDAAGSNKPEIKEKTKEDAVVEAASPAPATSSESSTSSDTELHNAKADNAESSDKKDLASEGVSQAAENSEVTTAGTTTDTAVVEDAASEPTNPAKKKKSSPKKTTAKTHSTAVPEIEASSTEASNTEKLSDVEDSQTEKEKT